MPALTDLKFTLANPEQLPRLQEIRHAAFAPVFASFRSILGDTLYEAAQARDDQAQAELLASMLEPSAGWELYAATRGPDIIGFVSVQLDQQTKVGQIGLNAVHPEHGGRGVGTAMYEFALSRMQAAGMQVATVGTGGDPSHAPARRAYRKVGFDVEIPSVWMYRLIE